MNQPIQNKKSYGFLIDNTRCIGCHACSTACKSENEVPLGVYRTWVKYTETGTFPDSRRHFQVTRCNHCANPPCARICPTGAMYQRDDGIVEFDKDACIGCKACMQACPYDAIHIDPSSGTASKCHYCSHRVEVGMEPSCVVVCPTHAIIAGDINDPTTEIAQRLAKDKVSVRKPEQGTGPKLFYVDGNDISMHPTATMQPDTYMWADVTTEQGLSMHGPSAQGLPQGGPIQIAGGRMAEHMVQTVYDAQHKVPWHWPVPAYLVTKGIAAGAFLLAALAHFGSFGLTRGLGVAASLIATIFMLATTALLIYDLEKPMRFLYILKRPQWRSWLARGAIFLMGFSTIAGVWFLGEATAALGWIEGATIDGWRGVLLGVGSPLAIGAAIYTAFLFGQAEGRDLWQSPLLPMHLLIQALMAGGAIMWPVAALLDAPSMAIAVIRWVFLATLVLDLFVTLLGEFGMPHASDTAARAAHEISHGRYARMFWLGAIVIGHVVPLVCLFVAPQVPALAAAAGLLTLGGLYAFEHAFVMAPQHVPNS